jgi:hypothetical protein
MINVELNWKELNINLNLVSKKMKEINNSYCGCSADEKLNVYFDNLTEEEAQLVKDYWES